MSKPKFGPGTQTKISLDRLGFDEEDNLQKFLTLPEHDKIQRKFDSVFPPAAKPKLSKMQAAAKAPPAELEVPEELDVGLSLGSAEEESALPAAGDLDLSLDASEAADFATQPGELSLGEAQDMELGMDSALDLSVGAAELGDDISLGTDLADDLGSLTGLGGADDTDSIQSPEDATSLKLGDDLDLGDDVLAKLAEIDQIMKEDATSATLTRPMPKEGTSSSDELGDALLASQVASEVAGDEFSSQSEVELFSAAALSQTPHRKKSPPQAPSVTLDGGEEISFNVQEDSEEVVPISSTGKAAQPAGGTEERESYHQVKGNFNRELERLQATLNHLTADRQELLKKIDELEEVKTSHGRTVLGLRAELDEKKIEVQLLKRRQSEDGQELKYQLELEVERRKLSEEKIRLLQNENLALQQKIKLEVRKVSSRERELEQKLELLKVDADTQIRHRDQKILELKRRIDALEFDMDAMNALEQKSVGDKQELEGKLDKAIKTLRTAIGILEMDDPKLATLEKLKKSLDV